MFLAHSGHCGSFSGSWSVWLVPNCGVRAVDAFKNDGGEVPTCVPICPSRCRGCSCRGSRRRYVPAEYVTTLGFTKAVPCIVPHNTYPYSILEIAPWTGRFYSLLDPSYAKNNIPIIASVSEHQPTAWSSFYFDLQFLVFAFPGMQDRAYIDG